MIFGDADRGTWRWKLLIALPDEAAEDELAAALAAGRAELEEPFAANLRVETFAEGRAAQVLHQGSYAAERPSIEAVHDAIAAVGFKPAGRHHEIYLGDPRRSDPGKVKTLLRQAMVPAG